MSYRDLLLSRDFPVTAPTYRKQFDTKKLRFQHALGYQGLQNLRISVEDQYESALDKVLEATLSFVARKDDQLTSSTKTEEKIVTKRVMVPLTLWDHVKQSLNARFKLRLKVVERVIPVELVTTTVNNTYFRVCPHIPVPQGYLEFCCSDHIQFLEGEKDG